MKKYFNIPKRKFDKIYVNKCVGERNWNGGKLKHFGVWFRKGRKKFIYLFLGRRRRRNRVKWWPWDLDFLSARQKIKRVAWVETNPEIQLYICIYCLYDIVQVGFAPGLLYETSNWAKKLQFLYVEYCMYIYLHNTMCTNITKREMLGIDIQIFFFFMFMGVWKSFSWIDVTKSRAKSKASSTIRIFLFFLFSL